MLRRLHHSFSLEKERFAKKETKGAASLRSDAPLETPFLRIRQIELYASKCALRTTFRGISVTYS